MEMDREVLIAKLRERLHQEQSKRAFAEARLALRCDECKRKHYEHNREFKVHSISYGGMELVDAARLAAAEDEIRHLNGTLRNVRKAIADSMRETVVNRARREGRND
jgi:hypothetical protein